MEMIRVNSSAMIAVGYDGATGQLRIMFKQGRADDYCRVSAQVHEGLMRAGSKGTYLTGTSRTGTNVRFQTAYIYYPGARAGRSACRFSAGIVTVSLMPFQPCGQK